MPDEPDSNAVLDQNSSNHLPPVTSNKFLEFLKNYGGVGFIAILIIGAVHFGQKEFHSVRSDIGEVSKEVGEVRKEVSEVKDEVSKMNREIGEIKASLAHESVEPSDKLVKIEP